MFRVGYWPIRELYGASKSENRTFKEHISTSPAEYSAQTREKLILDIVSFISIAHHRENGTLVYYL